MLSSLVDKSLLAVEDTGRFAMHPVIAAYAAQQLAKDPARAASGRARHAEFYARQLAALAPHARGDPRRLIDGVNAEFANARAAWHESTRQRRAELIEIMVPTWRAFYENRGRLVEGIDEMRLALTLPADGATAQRALSRVRHALSTLHYRKGDLQDAQAIGEAALELAERCGAHDALRGCLGNVGLCLWHAGRAADALLVFERSLALADADGDRHGRAVSLSHIAIAEKALGHFERALELNVQALAIERELGNQRGVASKLNNIGNLHRALGQWSSAWRHFVDGLQHCREYGLASAAPFLRLNLGLTEIEQGALASARTHLAAVLEEMRDAGQLQVELSVELGLARIDILQRDEVTAMQRLRRVVRLAAPRAFHTHPVQAAGIYGELLAARGDSLQAARVFLMASREAALDEMDRGATIDLLNRLALTDDELKQAHGGVPTLAQVLAAMGAAPAAPPGPDAGNAGETPPR
jgi:tetratricopeptide (TPR) repeat protein